MYNGLYAPNRPFTSDDQRLLTLAQPQTLVLRSDCHGSAEATFCHQHEILPIVVVNPERYDIHISDLEYMVATFGRRAVYQLGNEPDQPGGANTIDGKQLTVWDLRWYLELALDWQAANPDVLLLPPPISMGNAVRVEAFAHALGWLGQRYDGDTDYFAFADIYARFKALAIHIYDWDNIDCLWWLVDQWHQHCPTQPLYITEYGIDGDLDNQHPWPPAVPGQSQPQKVAAYHRFVTGLRQRDYIAVSAMFIAGNALPGNWFTYMVGDAVAGLAGA